MTKHLRRMPATRTRWSARHVAALRPQACPVCRKRQAVRGQRTFADAATWGAVNEYLLDCGHAVNGRGDLITVY